MSIPLTFDQAITTLTNRPGDYKSSQALLDLVSQVSVHATGDVTILYSGQPTPGITPQQIFYAMELNGESIRVIDNTDAARLINSREFQAAWAAQFGIDRKDLATQFDALSPTKQAAMRQMNEALYHCTDGPWANASPRFVDETVREVRTLTGGANAIAANIPQFRRCA